MRRIVTAREQAEMLSPWHLAATEPPDPTEYGYPKAHWGYEHSRWEPAREGWEDAGTHTWNIVPPSYPAMTTLEDDFGRSHTVYYDPERTQVNRGEFRPELSTRPNRIEDLSPPPGLLWRGMSDEEYQEARERGYFESRGEHNIGDEQKGRTYFSTDPGQAAHYADGFAPWQWQPTFDRPAHVVGIPNLPEYPQERITGGEGETERGLLGRIPFSQMSHHYTATPFAILPGNFDINNDNWENTWQQGGRTSPVVHSTWEADPEFSPRIATASGADYNGQTTHLTGEDMEGLQWDWGKGRWVPRPPGDDRLVPSREDRPFDYTRKWPGWDGWSFDQEDSGRGRWTQTQRDYESRQS